MSLKEIVASSIVEGDDGLKLQAEIQAELDRRKAELLAAAKEYVLKNLFLDKLPATKGNGSELEDKLNREVAANKAKAIAADKEYAKVVEEQESKKAEGHGKKETEDTSFAHYDKDSVGKGVVEAQSTQTRFKVTYNDGDTKKITYVTADSEVDAKRRFSDNTGKAADILSILPTKEYGR